MKQIKDIDYVFLSTRIKAMERGLLNKERIERMLEAPTNEDAANKARALLEKIYGKEKGSKVRYAESFQLSQYGESVSVEEFRSLFLAGE